MRAKWVWTVVGVALVIGVGIGAGRAAGREGRLEGVVRDAARRPLAGAVVAILKTTSREPVEEIAPLSDARGRFRFRPLPPGRYTLRASLPGRTSATATATATVRAGRTATVAFTLR